MIEFMNTAGFNLMSKYENNLALEIALVKGKLKLYEYKGNEMKGFSFDNFERLSQHVNGYGENNLMQFKELAETKLEKHKEYYAAIQEIQEKRQNGN